jgi:hypothetical protein
MRTPIPRAASLDGRLAQLERVTAALIELANPEQLRKAMAAATARTSMADLSKAVAAGNLALATRVTALSVAARFREVKADGEVVTPAVVVDLVSLDAATRALFELKSIGEQVTEVGDTRAILDQVWDRTAPARTHRPRGRHARR